MPILHGILEDSRIPWLQHDDQADNNASNEGNLRHESHASSFPRYGMMIKLTEALLSACSSIRLKPHCQVDHHSVPAEITITCAA